MFLPAILVGLDIVSKRIAVRFLRLSFPVILIPGWLRLVYVENSGAAFGILTNARWLLLTVSLIASGALIYLLIKKRYQGQIQKKGLQFVLAGAAGNLIDRMVLGYVVDFIDLPYWPTFNFADVFINIGVFFFLLDIIIDNKRQASKG